MPGDVIEVRNDQLYVNHEVIEEAYLQSNKNKLKKLMNLTEDFGPITVPKNKIFVMGDNRLISRDSRNGLGLIDKTDVLGELAAIYYPFEHMKIIIKVKTKQISVCLVFMLNRRRLIKFIDVFIFCAYLKRICAAIVAV